MPKTLKTNAGYGQYMVDACRKVGMKPVCNDDRRCKSDNSSIWLGNTYGNRLSYGYYRRDSVYSSSHGRYFAGGFLR